jgi:hypothetical protein
VASFFPDRLWAARGPGCGAELVIGCNLPRRSADRRRDTPRSRRKGRSFFFGFFSQSPKLRFCDLIFLASRKVFGITLLLVSVVATTKCIWRCLELAVSRNHDQFDHMIDSPSFQSKKKARMNNT